jgi:hypothetical protein
MRIDVRNFGSDSALGDRGAYLHHAAGGAIFLGSGAPEFVATDTIARGLLEHRAVFGIAGIMRGASDAYEAENQQCSNFQTERLWHSVTARGMN